MISWPIPTHEIETDAEKVNFVLSYEITLTAKLFTRVQTDVNSVFAFFVV